MMRPVTSLAVAFLTAHLQLDRRPATIERARRVPSLVVFFGVLIIVPTICLAGIASITWDSPPSFGWPTTYYINASPGDSPVQFSFTFQCTSGAGTAYMDPPIKNGSGVFGPFNENWVGNENLQGGENDMIGLGMTQWSFLTTPITVSPPDTEVIRAGLPPAVSV